MKIIYAFKKDDGSITGNMTEEELINGKNLKYNISDKKLEKIFLDFFRMLYPECQINIKKQKDKKIS